MTTLHHKTTHHKTRKHARPGPGLLAQYVSLALAVGVALPLPAMAAEDAAPKPGSTSPATTKSSGQAKPAADESRSGSSTVVAAASSGTDAAEDANAPATTLPSVTVTAQKREENIQKVSTAITVLGGKDLTDKGVGRSASEVLDYVPNASAGTQQNGRPRWWIRGVGAGQQQLDLANPVGFYRDEVYIGNASATGFPLFDLDRVEVLRGPQGTLWGKNTTGGAIAVFSRKPSFTDTRNDDYAKVGYGRFNDKIIEGGIGSVLVDERLASRISFYQRDTDGRFNNLFTGNKDGGLSDGALRGQFLAALTPDLEARLNLHFRDYKTDGTIITVASYAPNGLYRNGFVPSRNKRDVNSNAPASGDVEQYGGSLNLKWQLGRLSLTSITGYENYTQATLADGDHTPLEVSRSYFNGESRQWTQELRLASPREDRWNWIGGLYYFDEQINSNASAARLPNGAVPQLAGSTAPQAFTRTLNDHKAESYSIFGSTTYNLTERLSATLGARWTRETKKLDFDRFAAPNAAATSWSNLSRWWDSYTGTFGGANTFSRSLSKTWDAYTYDFTPAYAITPTDRVFFKYARGEKSGGFNTAAAAPAALQEVKPEKLDALELGYKSEWLEGRLNLNATAFYYDYRDIQVNVVGPNPDAPGGAVISYLQNFSKGTSKGLELELEALPTERLFVSASLGFLETRFNEAQVVNGGANLSGNEFVRSPHLTANLAANYRIPVANGGRVILGADTRYTSFQYFYVTPQDRINRSLVNQPAYAITNARITYSSPGERYTLTGYVNNLFDKDYKNHTLPAFQPGSVNGDIVYWGLPRVVGASFTARF